MAQTNPQKVASREIVQRRVIALNGRSAAGANESLASGFPQSPGAKTYSDLTQKGKGSK